ncbi:MAG: NAD-dependent epimerase/dehydratase family protein [Armatimonadota bacterium]
MKVLITGGAGFIGSHLADAFLAQGDSVVCMDQGSTAKIEHIWNHPNFKYVSDSVLNEQMVDTLVGQADLVYHLAAVVGVQHYVADPYAVLNVNVNGTQIVLRAAYRHGTKVVFSSTSEVYGRNPKIPWSEDDERVLGSTQIDRWCYSTSKAVGEHFCFAYHKLGLPVVVTRYFNAYGPRLDALDRGRVITIFLGKALRNEPITVVGDGQQTRCFTYVEDAIKATVKAGTVDAAVGGIYNIGTDVETNMQDLAEMVVRLSGSKSEIINVPQHTIYGQSYEDVPRRVPNVDRMHNILGVKAEISLEEGLSRTIEYFRTKEGQALTAVR